MIHVIIVAPAGKPGRYSATVDGKVIVASSRQPFLDGARALCAMGASPADKVVMRHFGSHVDALTGILGPVAAARVYENDVGDRAPTFRRHIPFLAGRPGAPE